MPDNSVSIGRLPYRGGGVQLSGYVARDERRTGPQPGIVVVHDAWGVGENVKMRATMLAELGFVAFVADLYGEGNAPRALEEARAKVDFFKSNVDALRERITAALETLVLQRDVRSSAAWRNWLLLRRNDGTRIGACRCGLCRGRELPWSIDNFEAGRCAFDQIQALGMYGGGGSLGALRGYSRIPTGDACSGGGLSDCYL